jgi:integrase
LASIHRHPNSKFWYCCINVPGHGQLQRTTKQTDRRKALEFAHKLESASRGALTEIQARKILAEIYEIRNAGEKLPGSSAKAFFDSWASNKILETAPATGVRYQQVVGNFINSLGKRFAVDISALTPRDIIAFRDQLAARVSASTANHAVKVIRMTLKDAQAAGLVTVNVAAGVRPIKSAETRATRRPFTLRELVRILRVANGEWRGLILFGLYTGQRLGDIASLTWRNIDLDRAELAFTTQKTKRRQLVPIAAPLLKFLEELNAGDNPAQPLFPKAIAIKRIGTLSNQFYEILVSAGLAIKRSHKTIGKGRHARRSFNEVSFHALRHTATSLMKNAGISPAIVGDIIGHDSPEVNAQYTHIEESAKRKAIAAMPDVTANEKKQAKRLAG